MENNILKRTITKPIKSTELSISKKHNPLISEKAIETLNYRIEQEEFSSRLYLSMSMWLSNSGYQNAGKLWLKYSKEEQNHADWSRDYLLSMGVQPNTPLLQAPGNSYAGLCEIIKLSYEHEIQVTEQCKQLAAESLKESDTMLFTLSQKYLAEQIDEHSKMQDHVDALEAFGEDKIALRLLDNSFEDLLN